MIDILPSELGLWQLMVNLWPLAHRVLRSPSRDLVLYWQLSDKLSL
ncbi:hypothetical protein [Thalassotalea litorea]|nr:hypothetical protein [Thalassotalea litorea]